MEDDCGWCDTSTTAQCTYFERRNEFRKFSFFFLFLRWMLVSKFSQSVSFLFISYRTALLLSVSSPSLLPVPVLSILTASLLSQLFFPWFCLSFCPLSFHFFWRVCEPQYVNLFSWRNLNVRFVAGWQVTSLSDNYLTSYTSRPRQDPSTASYWTVLARTLTFRHRAFSI
jgi:hypothetical protein